MARNHLRVDQVLQTCLELIENGQETVDSALARYPEYADQLRPVLEAAVWLRAGKASLDPRPGFISASRRRVVARYREEVAAEVERKRQFPWWGPLSLPWLNKTAVQALFALVLLVALLVGGNGVVMAAQDSLPGDRLYSVKTALEKVNLAISLDETKEARLNLEYTQRRMQEFNRLIQEKRYADLDESLEIYQEQLEQTIASLDSAANENTEQTKALAAQLENMVDDQNNYLEILIETADNAPDSAVMAIARAKTLSENVVSSTRRLLVSTPTPEPRGPRHQPGSEVDEEDTPTPRPPTPTSVPTRKPPEPTDTPRRTPTSAPVIEPTDVPTLIPAQPTNTPRPLPTSTPEPTKTRVPPTAVPTDTPEPTDTPTPRPTSTPTPLPTNTPTNTPTPVPTDTPTPEPTDTPTPEPTDTPTPEPPGSGTTPVEPTSSTEAPVSSTPSSATSDVLSTEASVQNLPDTQLGDEPAQ